MNDLTFTALFNNDLESILLRTSGRIRIAFADWFCDFNRASLEIHVMYGLTTAFTTAGIQYIYIYNVVLTTIAVRGKANSPVNRQSSPRARGSARLLSSTWGVTRMFLNSMAFRSGIPLWHPPPQSRYLYVS